MSTVLVLTGPDDPTANAVIAEIERRGSIVARYDLGDFPTRTQFTASHNCHGDWSGRIDGPDVSIQLEAVDAVYYRRPSRFRFPDEMSTADQAYAESEAQLGVGGVLAALPCLWVNHPHSIARAEWKPLQLETASQCGLRTPRTLITNDLTAAADFAGAVDGPIVCKPLSSVVLAENGTHRVSYTTMIDLAAVDPEVFAVTANLIQEWVPKAREERVTVAGKVALAVAIEADSRRAHIDWRADYDSLRYDPVAVPGEVLRGIQVFLRALNLHYGAFDFVITPDDRWIMLECNPSGQWLWLHHRADLPIPGALADLLTGGRP